MLTFPLKDHLGPLQQHVMENVGLVSRFYLLPLFTCFLYTEREQVLNSLENTQKPIEKSAKLSNFNISNILLFRTQIFDISTSKILFNAVLQ